MKCQCLGLVFVLSLLLLSLAPSWAQEDSTSPAAAMPSTYEISAPELARLIEISKQLDKLNISLRSELASSRQGSQTLKAELDELRPELEASRSEAAALKSESKTLMTELGELRTKLAESSTASAELRAALTKAEASSANWEASWKAYEAEAQAKIKRLVLERNVAAAAAIVFLILVFVL